MRVAVLLNGQLRSFQRVSHFLRDHLLEPNDAVVFAALESSQTEDEVRRVLATAFPNTEIGGLIVRPTFRDEEFNKILQLIPGRPAVTDAIFDLCSKRDHVGWNINYLYQSGSVLQ
jgi:hypothetical protein